MILQQCIGQDNAYFKSDSCEDCEGLPLPSDEDSFLNGSPIVTQYLDKNGDVHTLENADPKASPSIFGESVKTYCYWFVMPNIYSHDHF